ncbi:uncharacterized protein LOC110634198 isoform X2 [Hevea brasiliensis]|uniref:uncharacterized protein LOC110634198 isoform X2 n=1 Tax=Hevea brasiliensis TaxID=3981 RepID=UPI0025EB8FDA|nr:uncharacterized protein LOC110634198 isoform X2 [Hevea brasiliensis]
MAMAESAMFVVPQTIGNILCCKCGILMVPNGANMCVTCLRSEIDITEGLRKRVIILHCPDCTSYLKPPSTWIEAQLESKELLKFCVDIQRKQHDKAKVRLVDAFFIWTEPHSKRIKVKLKIQKDVFNGTILEQSYVVEYVVQPHLCENCSRVQVNPDQWVAVVQLRQHVSHRRTFFFLEQLILKHGAAVLAIKIKQVDEGIDFFFAKRSYAMKFVEFIGKVVPLRTRYDRQLVSHDSKSNKYNYKYTFSVEICPICREDLICLPPKVASNLGNIGPLVICMKVMNGITLLDPFTLRHCFLNADQYWRASFQSLLTSRQLVEYIILDVEPLSYEVSDGNRKYNLADAQVARKCDFGKNNNIFYIRTHLGHILSAGDSALGYDIYGANSNGIELDKYRGLVLPDAILIKKSYGESNQRKHRDAYGCKSSLTNMEVDESGVSEYEEFCRDLEENPDLRFNLSLEESLEELLADLDLSEEHEDNMRE